MKKIGLGCLALTILVVLAGGVAWLLDWLAWRRMERDIREGEATA